MLDNFLRALIKFNNSLFNLVDSTVNLSIKIFILTTIFSISVMFTSVFFNLPVVFFNTVFLFCGLPYFSRENSEHVRETYFRAFLR